MGEWVGWRDLPACLFIQRVRFVNGALNTSFTKFVVKMIL